jgi:hypothetical protein
MKIDMTTWSAINKVLAFAAVSPVSLLDYKDKKELREAIKKVDEFLMEVRIEKDSE